MSRYTDTPKPALRCVTHPVSIDTAMALANDAAKSGDTTAAKMWFDLAEEMDLAAAEEKRKLRERERELLLRHGRRYGF